MNLTNYILLIMALTITPIYSSPIPPDNSDNSEEDEEFEETEELEEDEEGISPFAQLINAIIENNPVEVEQLLDAHQEIVLERDEDGQTALRHAAFMADQESAEHLIDAGADVNATDSNGQTALHVVAKTEVDSVYAQAGLVMFARFLIENGAALNLPDNQGRTPAQIAREIGNNVLADELELRASRR